MYIYLIPSSKSFSECFLLLQQQQQHAVGLNTCIINPVSYGLVKEARRVELLVFMDNISQ